MPVSLLSPAPLPLRPAAHWWWGRQARPRLRDEVDCGARQCVVPLDLDEPAMVSGRLGAVARSPLLQRSIILGGSGLVFYFGTLPAVRAWREARAAQADAGRAVQMLAQALPPVPAQASQGAAPAGDKSGAADTHLGAESLGLGGTTRRSWHKNRAAALRQAQAEQSFQTKEGWRALLAAGGTGGMGLALLSTLDMALALWPGAALAGSVLLGVSVPAVVVWALWGALSDVFSARTAAQRAAALGAHAATADGLDPGERFVLGTMQTELTEARAWHVARALAGVLLAVAAPLTIFVSGWGLLLMLPAIVGVPVCERHLAQQLPGTLPEREQLLLGTKRSLCHDLGFRRDLAVLLERQRAAYNSPARWLRRKWAQLCGAVVQPPGAGPSARLGAFWRAYAQTYVFWLERHVSYLEHKAQQGKSGRHYAAQAEQQRRALQEARQWHTCSDAALIPTVVSKLDLLAPLAQRLLADPEQTLLLEGLCADGRMDMAGLLQRLHVVPEAHPRLCATLEDLLAGHARDEAYGARNLLAALHAQRLAAGGTRPASHAPAVVMDS